MKARDIMTKNVEIFRPDESVMNVILAMKLRNFGFVPVVHDYGSRGLAGVVTDRDIALFLGRSHRKAEDVKISECMTLQPVSVREDASPQEIARMMEEFQVHRLPVLDSKKRVVGVVSLKNLADLARTERMMESPDISEGAIAEIVEMIAQG